VVLRVMHIRHTKWRDRVSTPADRTRRGIGDVAGGFGCRLVCSEAAHDSHGIAL